MVGVGMIPRNEVGLIFAQMGLTTGIFSSRVFSALTLMVMLTTFLTPPLLRLLFPPGLARGKPVTPEGIQDSITEP